MIFAIYLGCLIITSIVLQTYIVGGFHSDTHRFLPLILGLIGTYEFYLMVGELTHSMSEDYRILKDLLLMEILYFLFYYIMEFMHVKVGKIEHFILFLFWVGSNVLLLVQIKADLIYWNIVIGYVFASVLLILILATRGFVVMSFSKIEHRAHRLLYLAICMPGLAVIFRMIQGKKYEWLIALTLAGSCLIIIYLLKTEQLLDTFKVLQDRLFYNAELPILLFDSDFYFLAGNESASNLMGEKIKEMIDDPKGYKLLEIFREWSNNLNETKEIKIKNYFYEVRLTSVKYHNKIQGYIMTGIDITNQKQEVFQMENEKISAENNAELKAMFLANMSHELRSPLHAIISGSDILLKQNEMSINSWKMLMYIKNAGDNLLKIVNSILDFSKFEAGEFKLAKERYDFNEIIQEQSNICFVNTLNRPIDFLMELTTDYPKELIGDGGRVRSIIQNLLSNAMKFTETGYINCRISTYIQKRFVKIEIRVEDSGCGITKKQINNIFNEYVTFSERKSKEGTGLGLNIVKKMAERMGGGVKVESDGSSGSIFQVELYQELGIDDSKDEVTILKAKKITKDELTEQLLNVKRTNITPKWIFPQAKVLVVDDMEVNRKIFKEVTMEWKFTVEEAEDGESAIELVKKNKYQLIFLDQMMPKMTGEETAIELRKITDTPLIMITANMSESINKNGLNENFQGFLSKPIDLKKMQKILEEKMPKEYGIKPKFDILQIKKDNKALKENYFKALESYINQTRKISENLIDILESDLELFRTKVHGIKGGSKMLGLDKIGEFSEVMEMAAKTGNTDFIWSHMESYLRDLGIVLDNATSEVEIWKGYQDKNRISGEEFHFVMDQLQLWKNLQVAFDEYDMVEIERCLEKINKLPLDESRKELVGKLKYAAENFEYEDGSSLLKSLNLTSEESI